MTEYNGIPCKEWAWKYGRHRQAWIAAHGEIPEETPWVLHHCDNRLCYEITHLFLGTAKDNAKDREAKGRGGLTRDSHGCFRAAVRTRKEQQ